VVDRSSAYHYLSRGIVLIAISQETLQGPNRKDLVRIPSCVGIVSEPGRQARARVLTWISLVIECHPSDN